MKITTCLKQNGYKQQGNLFIKPIKDDYGQTIVNVMFSKDTGHFPLHIAIGHDGEPRLEWKDAKVDITAENVDKLCKDVDAVCKKYKIAEVDYTLSKIK